MFGWDYERRHIVHPDNVLGMAGEAAAGIIYQPSSNEDNPFSSSVVLVVVGISCYAVGGSLAHTDLILKYYPLGN